MIHKPSLIAGAGAAIAARALLPHVALFKLRRDVRRLNAGDLKPVLAGYADDASCTSTKGRTAGRAITAASRRSNASCASSPAPGSRARSVSCGSPVPRGR